MTCPNPDPARSARTKSTSSSNANMTGTPCPGGTRPAALSKTRNPNHPSPTRRSPSERTYVGPEDRPHGPFLGDLGTQSGDGPAVTDEDLLDAAIAAEDLFRQTSLGPAVPATYRRLADLEPATLAVMHGSSYTGDCAGLLRALADLYEERYGCGSALRGNPLPAHQQPVG